MDNVSVVEHLLIFVMIMISIGAIGGHLLHEQLLYCMSRRRAILYYCII